MIHGSYMKRLTVAGSCLALTLTGCSFQGVNSLPLPGAEGTGPGATSYTVEIANVATLESNAPVLIDDVVVGSVRKMTVDDWHAEVQISVKPDVVVPANAVATVGQTSLLGSMHLALNPPLGESPEGRLQAGATIPLSDSSTYPSTERTLSSLSVVANGGGLGQIGDIIHNFNLALSGREPEIRQLITRLDNFVGVLDAQRENIIASIQQLNRVAGTFAGQRDTIDRALKEIPPALDVLISERPRLTAALDKLGKLGDTATALVEDAGDDLVKDLENLGPALGALADIGPDLNLALLWASAFPYGPTFADRITRGDYINLFATFDITYPRLKKTLLLGTRWGDENAKLIPAPGDPYYLNYSYSPMSIGVAPPPAEAPAGATMPPVSGPLLPVSPPPPAAPWLPQAPVSTSSQIFAGPYGAESAPPADAQPPAPPADAQLPAPADAQLPAPADAQPGGGG
ncbi:mammalian cell entry protein [Mycolicibacterium monacense]|nr:mammalian cell entry protein [Mycolicibacterium monacense]